MGNNHYDIAIIGNGIIGTLVAYEIIKKNEKIKIAFIGERNRPNSASLAAGAMNAVYGEVECNYFKSESEQRQFNNSLKARKLWIHLIKEIKGGEIIAAKDTIIYRNKKSTQFEEENFSAAIQIACRDNCLEDLTRQEKSNIFTGTTCSDDYIANKLIGEFSINPSLLFEKLDKIIANKSQITKIFDYVLKIEEGSNGINKIVNNKSTLSANLVIIANGSNASEIIPEYGVVPIVKAVGTAFILENINNLDMKSKFVVRSVNRGGAQCGIHIVPYNNFMYVGAGNYITSNKVAKHRIETIRYLTNTVENELLGRTAVYKSQVSFLLGFRPRSIDGSPIIG